MLLTVYQIVFGLLFATGLPLLMVALYQLFTKKGPIANRFRIQSPIGLVDVGFTFVLWFVFQGIGMFLATKHLGISMDALDQMTDDQKVTFMLWTSLAQMLATLIAIAVIAMRYRSATRIFGIQPEYTRADIWLGFVAFLTVVPVLLAIQASLTYLVDYQHPTLNALTNNPTWLTIGITWLTAVIIAPITEEIFFRGVLQNWLQRIGNKKDESIIHPIVGGFVEVEEQTFSRREKSKPTEEVPNDDSLRTAKGDKNPYQTFGASGGKSAAEKQTRVARTVSPKFVLWDSSARWMPILISAALFGLVHIGQGPAPITLFLFGLALGYLYRQTGSIVPCIILHMLLNGYSMFWLTLQTFFPESTPIQ